MVTVELEELVSKASLSTLFNGQSLPSTGRKVTKYVKRIGGSSFNLNVWQKFNLELTETGRKLTKN